MSDTFIIRQIGEVSTDFCGDEETFTGVVLQGDVEAVRELVSLFGVPVRVVRADPVTEQSNA